MADVTRVAAHEVYTIPSDGRLHAASEYLPRVTYVCLPCLTVYDHVSRDCLLLAAPSMYASAPQD